MKKVVIEIDDCAHCPYSVAYENKWFCKKADKELIFNEDAEILHPIPDWCPQEISHII